MVHFGVLLLFYHELTLYQDEFSPFVLNIGVISLIASITTLGLMLDKKRRYDSLYELIRCLLFFQLSYIISPIIDHGLERAYVEPNQRVKIMLALNALFGLSVLINSLQLIAVFFSNNLQLHELFYFTHWIRRAQKYISKKDKEV